MIIAIDTETYNYNQATGTYTPTLNARQFTIGCAKTDTGKTHYFYTPEEMKNYLIKTIETNKKNNKRTFIYAHNHEYDFYGIWQDDLLNKKIKYICYNPFIAIYDEKGYFLDTMAFYRMSLEKIGQILKYPKKEMPKEITNKDQLKEYVERDTEIVLKAITELKQKINKLGFKPRKLLTSGQLAITSFLTYCRRNNLNKEITEYNKDKKIYQIIKTKHAKKIREAFRGGMNQCFQIGKFENVTLIDANALYGHIMTKMDFPDLKSEQLINKPETGMLKEYTKQHIGIARITIKSPKQELPFLPIRFTRFTIYPSNKKLRGTWTFQEIKEAIKLGYKIESCEWCIKWKKAETNPLKEFIQEIYKQEQALKYKEEKIPLKMIRNNLYGKFAQYKNNKEYEIVPRHKIEQKLEEGFKPISSIEDKYICAKELDEYNPSYTNPIISTIITAGARIFLYKNLKKIPKRDLLYCDTDSIAFKGNHKHKFDINKGLGKWKIEAEGKAKFLGEKRYYIDDKPKISGLMKREISIETIEKEQDVKTKRMLGLQTGIKEGKLEQVGTFKEHIQEMKPHNKLMLIVPEEIDEVREYG